MTLTRAELTALDATSRLPKHLEGITAGLADIEHQLGNEGPLVPKFAAIANSLGEIADHLEKIAEALELLVGSSKYNQTTSSPGTVYVRTRPY